MKNEIHTIYKNEEEAPKALRLWLEAHKEELLNYPNHYLLILLPKGIVAVGRSREELMLELGKMSERLEDFTTEELMQPSFIVNTLVMDKKNWGIA